METKRNRYIDEDGVIRDLEGNVQSMLDFVATKEFIPRYYDYHTKNTSFLNIHVLLKKMGMKNHNEHLQIFDQSLIGIDPHSPVLTDIEKAKILNEIRINPWYYFREVARVNNGAISFRLDVAAFYAIFFMTRCIKTLEELPRQTGKTVALVTYMGWLIAFGTTNTAMGNVHYSDQEVMKNVDGILSTLNSLPEYLQLHKKIIRKNAKDGDLNIKDRSMSASKKRDIKCDIYKNVLDCFIVGNDSASANKTGRGRTIPVWMIDELAHIKFNGIAYAALAPAYIEAAKTARKAGKPYGIWCLCTPGDMKTEEGKWCRAFIDEQCMIFGPKHFKVVDMCREELEEYINKYSRSGTVHISFNHRMLGYNSSWMSKKSALLNIPTIRSEVMLRWEVKTNQSPFSGATLSALETRTQITDKRTLKLELDDEGNVIEYTPDANMPKDFLFYLLQFKEGLVIGIDVASGSGGDYSTMVAVDPKTLRVVFTYRNNTISVDQFAIVVWRIMQEYFITYQIPLGLAIERNSHGYSLIAILKRYDDLSKYFVVYPVSEAKLFNPSALVDYTFSYKNSMSKFDIGLVVNENVRNQLVNILIQLVTKYTDAISYRPITDEVKTLIRKVGTSGKERIEHSAGEHDDVLFGLMHAVYAIFYNSDLLKLRNNIIVTPENFIINDSALSINTSGITSRVSTTYVSENGKLIDKYYDTLTKQYISRQDAEKIMLDEKLNGLITAEKKDPIEVEAESKKNTLSDDEYDVLKSSFGDNVIVSKEFNSNVLPQTHTVPDDNEWNDWYASLLK